jgi:hypothetical protein
LGNFADYSHFLAQGDKLAEEDAAWLRDHTQEREEVAALVNRIISENDIETMIEFGCGTGWVGQVLPPHVWYTGVDGNSECVAIAQERNRKPTSDYKHGDIRQHRDTLHDLVCSISFLKHFGLHEWEGVMDQFLSFGRYAIFTLQLTDGDDYDDGTEYHHVWIGPDTLKSVLKGHETLFTDLRWSCPNSTDRDVLYAVKRKTK